MSKNNSQESLFTSAEQMAEADNYNEWTFSLFKQYIKGNVLEVGCGVGSFTNRIIQHGSFQHLLCIDISQNAIDHCRAKFTAPSIKFQCIDVQKVLGEFDAIICMNVLEHIQDHEEALKHLFNILKPGGTLFLLVPAHPVLFNRFDTEGGHFRRYNKQVIRELMTKVTGNRQHQLNQFYFNSVGALGYWFVYKILNKAPQNGAGTEIGLFDRLVVPIMRKLEGQSMPFGISLISIITKG